MSNRMALVRGGLFVGLFVLVIGVCVLFNSLTSSSGVVISGRTRGNPNARVTLVEFADFQ
ncbi:MAG: hypothetical protein M1482_04375 [Chloroflexi bacterium]|nr:hypothetical protein [Chloroflexota bacterium]